MTRSEKVTREILHFSLRVVCQLFWVAAAAESSQNCSLDGVWPIPAVLIHQHFVKVECPSTAGYYPALVFCPDAIERQREPTPHLGSHIHSTLNNLEHCSYLRNTGVWVNSASFYIQETSAEGWAWLPTVTGACSFWAKRAQNKTALILVAVRALD